MDSEGMTLTTTTTAAMDDIHAMMDDGNAMAAAIIDRGGDTGGGATSCMRVMMEMILSISDGVWVEARPAARLGVDYYCIIDLLLQCCTHACDMLAAIHDVNAVHPLPPFLKLSSYRMLAVATSSVRCPQSVSKPSCQQWCPSDHPC